MQKGQWLVALDGHRSVVYHCMHVHALLWHVATIAVELEIGN